MGKIFNQLSLIIILVVLSIPSAFAVSKSESKYKGDALMSSQSDNIGFNLHWAQKCGFGGDHNIANEVARLSWEDFKRFNSGWAGMNNRSSSGCTPEAKQQVLSEKRSYLAELKNKVNQKLGISTSTQTVSSSSSSSNSEFSSFSNKKLCMYASNKGKWETSFHFKKHVEEAKRRGITCGIGGSTQTASSGSSSN